MNFLLYLPPFAIVFSFLVHLIFVRLISKVWKPKSPQQMVALIAVAIGLGAFILGFSLSDDLNEEKIWLGAYLGGTSFLFSYTYFHLFNMANTARRIHLLILYLHKDRLGSSQEMEYQSSVILDQRVDRLVAMGALREKEGKLLAPFGILLVAAKCISKMRSLFYKEG